MMQRIHVRLGLIAMLAIAACVAVGCEKQEATKPTTTAAKTPAPDNAAIEAKLAAADKLDGKADKIVHKCASCALSMNGKPEFTLETHGYTMHFCAKGCKENFAEETDKKIADLTIPDK